MLGSCRLAWAPGPGGHRGWSAEHTAPVWRGAPGTRWGAQNSHLLPCDRRPQRDWLETAAGVTCHGGRGARLGCLELGSWSPEASRVVYSLSLQAGPDCWQEAPAAGPCGCLPGAVGGSSGHGRCSHGESVKPGRGSRIFYDLVAHHCFCVSCWLHRASHDIGTHVNT